MSGASHTSLHLIPSQCWPRDQWCTVLCFTAQLWLTVSNHMAGDALGCSPPGSSVHEDSPGKNTGVGCHALLQGIFPTQGSTQVSCIAGQFFTIWAIREAQKYWSGYPIPSPRDLPNPGIEPGSPAFQANSLPADLPGNPNQRCYENLYLAFAKTSLCRKSTDVFMTLRNQSEISMTVRIFIESGARQTGWVCLTALPVTESLNGQLENS